MVTTDDTDKPTTGIKQWNHANPMIELLHQQFARCGRVFPHEFGICAQGNGIVQRTAFEQLPADVAIGGEPGHGAGWSSRQDDAVMIDLYQQ